MRLFVLVIAICCLQCSKRKEQEPVPIGFGEMRNFGDHRQIEIGWESIDGSVMCGTLFLPKEQGEYPAVIWHFGSNRWSRLDNDINFTKRWLDAGIAVLSYDKRGVNKSQGYCCPWRDPNYFPLLGQDVLHGIKAIALHPEIKANAIGAFGYSQGGWVVPVAAAELQNDIAFTVIGSGPTVTLHEELAYSELTGENTCQETNITQEEIDTALEEIVPGGFDPRPYLERMTNPSLWVFGENDLSVPTRQSTAIIEHLIQNEHKPFEYWILPDANHSWITNGGICEYFSENHFADPYDEIFDWILSKTN